MTSSAAGTSRSPRGPVDLDDRAEARGDGGQLGGRVGVGEAAADRAAAAQLAVPDEGQGPADQGHGGGQRIALDAALTHGGADVQLVPAPFEAAELVQRRDVDERPRPAQAHREHRHEGLAAGEHLGVARGEGLDGVGDRARAVVGERCGLHVQRPVNRGVRFSVNAATPSAKSWLERSIA